MRPEEETESPVRDVDWAACLFLTLMVLIGSSTAPAARFAVRELPVGLLPLVRFGVAGLCLLPLVGAAALRRIVREDGWRLLLAAALCVPVNQAFFLNGAKLTLTSHVALIYAACPLVVLLFARAVGQEQLVMSRLAGVLASILGVAVIGLGSVRQGGVGGSVFWGDLLTIGAVTSWGAYLTASKPLIARHGALPVLAATFLAGTLLDLPIALAIVPQWPLLGGASGAAWRGLAYLTLVVTVLGLACQNQALRRLDASQVATVGNGSPVLTVIWGVWLFEEALTPEIVLGGVLTLGGIIAANRAPRCKVAAELGLPPGVPAVAEQPGG
ncbi:MAG: DMT family transporter [Isosphaeraceae bacterium]|nr:DMT family transporter [Isosphaeraceae bacterium]